MEYLILLLFFYSHLLSFVKPNGYSMVKEIEGIIYIGGENYLAAFNLTNENKLISIAEQVYLWPQGTMNGSDIGFTPYFTRWSNIIPNKNLSLAFDNCLNWKDAHPNNSVRDTAYDQYRLYHHTMSGDWSTMNYTCSNSFIKGIEVYGEEQLWVCGTFGAFPRAFLVNKTNLEFQSFVDWNVMSCARYMDEPMATYRDKDLKNLYVATGWGLYRPDKLKPDVPNNNSTMMFADWRLYRNLFTLPSSMAWVLSSDVNFINVVKETEDHLYFFGHEISNQYGLNNQEDRQAWQSFLLRVCKRDLGFKYVSTEIYDLLERATGSHYHSGRVEPNDYVFALHHSQQGYNKSWYESQAHLPTTHFATPLKINFGCFIGKKPRSISDNHFWGETNVVYMNRLADVIFDPNRTINFRTKDNSKYFGCNPIDHSQIPLIGLFNRPGIADTGVEPTGALCQLQINANIFKEVGSKKNLYHKNNLLFAKNAYEEIMGLSSTSFSNFYSRTMHRTNGFTLYPFWNQGVLIGDNQYGSSYKKAFDHTGTCETKQFYENLSKDQFLKNMNFSNTAWPNELPNRLTSLTIAVCQYSSAELYSFNASFVVPGVEFKRIFLIEENITDYVMHTLVNEADSSIRRFTSPLMIVGIVSTRGDYFRVVLCDFDNAMLNRGSDHTDESWYNWCIFRNTDQPYLYRQYAPMENRSRTKNIQFRGSSLLIRKKIVSFPDLPQSRDPHFHVVKDVLRKGNTIHVLTVNKLNSISLAVRCSSYDKCIECASDPMCMWNIKKAMCQDYSDKNYRSSMENIQDVLDRGFRCGTIDLAVTPELFKGSAVVTLKCKNVGFWRGKIVWKFGDNETLIESSSTILKSKNGDLLTLLQNSESYKNVSCYGLLDDFDKLYDDSEYNYGGSIKIKEKLLNNFKQTSDGLSQKILITLVISILINVLCLILFVIYRRIFKFVFKCQCLRRTRRNRSQHNLDEYQPCGSS